MASPLLHLRSVLFRTGAAETVTYTPPGAGPVPVPDVQAVRSGDAAGSLTGQGNPLRGVSFEIQRSGLATAPLQSGIITDAEGKDWIITQVADQDFTDSYICTVGEA
ncbi:MAG: hypothetical protein B7Y35_06080 [Sphingomonadales bacterium 28-64-96]|nr:MAG: hypothetical protein B7Y35_06080 [Sphingomonadales bacterium 28-64-96]